LFDDKSAVVVNDLYSYVTDKSKTGSYNEWASKIDLNNSEIKAFIELGL
jgi:hypothetical protein